MDTINRVFVDGAETEPTYKKKRGIVLLRREGQYIYISGHGPEDQVTGKPLFSGRIGKDLTPDEGRQAARECAIIILGALKDTLGTLDRVERFVKVFALVNCAEGFTDVDGVMDGFSDTLADGIRSIWPTTTSRPRSHRPTARPSCASPSPNRTRAGW